LNEWGLKIYRDSCCNCSRDESTFDTTHSVSVYTLTATSTSDFMVISATQALTLPDIPTHRPVYEIHKRIFHIPHFFSSCILQLLPVKA
jgi:hypothetical protein